MKYIFLTMALLLVGCKDSVIDNNQDAFTTKEAALFESFSKSNTLCKGEVNYLYEPALEFLRKTRDAGRSYNLPGDSIAPFCEAVDVIRGVEVGSSKVYFSSCNNRALNPKFTTFYEEVMGFPLQKCGRTEPSAQPASDSTFKVTVTPGTVKLSPALYDELISAVKTCRRAENAVLEGFTPNEVLSQKDYDKAISTILECKKFQLEKTLNDKAPQ